MIEKILMSIAGWRTLHLSVAECGSAFSLGVCDGMVAADLCAAVTRRLRALAGCERAAIATEISWYLTLDGGDDAEVPLSPALPDGTRLVLHVPPAWRPLGASARHGSPRADREPRAAPAPSPHAAADVVDRDDDDGDDGGATAAAAAARGGASARKRDDADKAAAGSAKKRQACGAGASPTPYARAAGEAAGRDDGGDDDGADDDADDGGDDAAADDADDADDEGDAALDALDALIEGPLADDLCWLQGHLM